MLNDRLLTLLFLVLPLIFAGMALLSAGYEQWLKQQLQQSGITTEASIVELIHDAWRGTRNYYLSYEYKLATGDVEFGRQPISQSHYDKLQSSTNHVVLISYLPSKPSVSRLTGEDEDFGVRDAALKRAGLLLIAWVVLLVVALLQR